MFPTDSLAIPGKKQKKIISVESLRQSVRHLAEGRELFSFPERTAFLEAFGSHALAYSTLQPGMSYFDVPGKGYVAYMRKWGVDFVLSDPVCSTEDIDEVLTKFISSHGKRKNFGFAQVTEPVAMYLHKNHGMYATQFGIETIVDLDSWSLSGKKKQVLRTACNQAKKKGIRIIESEDSDECHSISAEWMKTRKIKHREIVFLIRPMDMAYQKDTRKFFAYMGKELIGFAFFDPIYQDGRVIGYIPSISRFRNIFRQGIFYVMMVKAFSVFKNEGARFVNLGLSPVGKLDKTDHPHESRILKALERLLFEYGNMIYNFKGLQFAKSRFGGKEHKVYCCHHAALPAFKLAGLFKTANFF